METGPYAGNLKAKQVIACDATPLDHIGGKNKTKFVQTCSDWQAEEEKTSIKLQNLKGKQRWNDEEQFLEAAFLQRRGRSRC